MNLEWKPSRRSFKQVPTTFCPFSFVCAFVCVFAGALLLFICLCLSYSKEVRLHRPTKTQLKMYVAPVYMDVTQIMHSLSLSLSAGKLAMTKGVDEQVEGGMGKVCGGKRAGWLTCWRGDYCDACRAEAGTRKSEHFFTATGPAFHSSFLLGKRGHSLCRRR